MKFVVEWAVTIVAYGACALMLCGLACLPYCIYLTVRRWIIRRYLDQRREVVAQRAAEIRSRDGEATTPRQILELYAEYDHREILSEPRDDGFYNEW